MKKEKIYLYLTTIFVILTFVLAGYVLAKEGKVNEGISLIPCLISLIFSKLYIKEKQKNKKINEQIILKNRKINNLIIIIVIIFLIMNICVEIIAK